jgi:hypothetical protein
MPSSIHPYPNYIEGAMKDPKTYVAHQGDNFVMGSDGKIYNCHPRINGLWPIRFEIKSYDSNYTFVTDILNLELSLQDPVVNEPYHDMVNAIAKYIGDMEIIIEEDPEEDRVDLEHVTGQFILNRIESETDALNLIAEAVKARIQAHRNK